ncbi:MAG: hypothetical protein QOF57_2470 [Frankiaceae bacterium]|nr:hypothetical protein [Frankiaceae bacterium]MDQ1726230.1 hypothetical protein [Frankiaceae bacterium]
MKFLLLVCVDPAITPDSDSAAEWVDLVGPARILGNQLVEPADGKTVRVRDNETVLTDGPFAETKEYMAGFDIIECADMDDAVRIAASHPVARFGSIEVRAFAPNT